MSRRTLSQWLNYQQQAHTKDIDMGLDRVGRVWRRLRPDSLQTPVITIAGTNGKGSCLAFLDAILTCASYRTACYSSPHLVRYNERIRIAGQEVDDASLCTVFECIENARDGTTLTYFEYATLAALLLFSTANIHVILLEVGLGGRFDATNLIDADGSIITSISLDHTNWLGGSLESIAHEKAGVMRSGRPVVIAQKYPPKALARQAKQIGAKLIQRGHDFCVKKSETHWSWLSENFNLRALPLPALSGQHQVDNAAAVIALLWAMHECLPVSKSAIRSGLLKTRVAGRIQQLNQQPLVIVDVAHNQGSVQALAETLKQHAEITGWHAIVSMYSDKPVNAVVQTIGSLVTAWHIYPLQSLRAMPLAKLHRAITSTYPNISVFEYENFDQAYTSTRAQVKEEYQGILIFGSFEVAGEAIAKLSLLP